MTRRHPTVEHLCNLIGAIVHGRAAAQLLEDGVGEDERLIELPVWAWAPAKAHVGRKDLDTDGGRMLLPVRLSFNPGHLVLLGAEEIEVAYTGSGLGNETYGVVSAHPDSPPGGWVDGHLQAPDTWGPTVTGTEAVTSRLQHLLDAGQQAQWTMMEHLERRAARMIYRSVSSLRHERERLGQGPEKLLDETSIEALRNRLVYGDPGSGPSTVQRLVERCTAVRTFASCDPEHYITISLRRDAKYEVQKALGDPHVGTKVRRLYEEMGTDTDIETELVPEYRRRYPADRLDAERARAALVMASDPMAGVFALGELDHVQDKDEASDPLASLLRNDPETGLDEAAA